MSEGVIALQRRFGHRGSETWHLAHCPMAFDNAGADWLQRGTQINNPYFGAQMLRCGGSAPLWRRSTLLRSVLCCLMRIQLLQKSKERNKK